MNNSRREILKTLSLITQLGLTMITAIALCTAAGIWLDKTLGTSFLTLIFLVLGVLGGGKASFTLAKRSVTMSREEEEDRDVSLRK